MLKQDFELLANIVVKIACMDLPELGEFETRIKMSERKDRVQDYVLRAISAHRDDIK